MPLAFGCSLDELAIKTLQFHKVHVASAPLSYPSVFVIKDLVGIFALPKSAYCGENVNTI